MDRESTTRDESELQEGHNTLLSLVAPPPTQKLNYGMRRGANPSSVDITPRETAVPPGE